MKQRRIRLSWLISGLVLLSVGMLAIVLQRSKRVEVIHADRQVVAQILTASGQVQGVQSSPLTLEAPGVLAELLVKEGDEVLQGQIIARAVPTVAQARVAQAEEVLNVAIAQREEIAKENARYPLWKAQTRAETDAALADARGRVQRAEARLEELLGGGTAEERQQAESSVQQATLQVTLARQQYQRASNLAEADATASAEVQTAVARLAEAEARMRMAQESLQAAERDATRYTSLYERGAVARSQQESAVSARDTARAALAQSEAQRDQSAIALARQQELLTLTRRAEADDAAMRLEIAEKALETTQSRLRELRQAARPETIAQQRAEVQAARTVLQAASEGGTARTAYQQAEPNAQRLMRANAQIREARAALASTRAQLASLTIIAPFTGYVIEVYARPGTVVGPTQPVLTVSQMAQAEVKVNVDEREFAKLYPGQQVTVLTDAKPTVELSGRVAVIGAQVDTQSGVVPVTVRLSSVPAWLRSGMTADATFRLEDPTEHLVLPSSAVLRDGEKSQLLLVTDGRVTTRNVQAGNSSPKGVVILDGVTERELVIRDPLSVKPGQQVRPLLTSAKGAR